VIRSNGARSPGGRRAGETLPVGRSALIESADHPAVLASFENSSPCALTGRQARLSSIPLGNLPDILDCSSKSWNGTHIYRLIRSSYRALAVMKKIESCGTGSAIHSYAVRPGPELRHVPETVSRLFSDCLAEVRQSGQRGWSDCPIQYHTSSIFLHDGIARYSRPMRTGINVVLVSSFFELQSRFAGLLGTDLGAPGVLWSAQGKDFQTDARTAGWSATQSKQIVQQQRLARSSSSRASRAFDGSHRVLRQSVTSNASPSATRQGSGTQSRPARPGQRDDFFERHLQQLRHASILSVDAAAVGAVPVVEGVSKERDADFTGEWFPWRHFRKGVLKRPNIAGQIRKADARYGFHFSPHFVASQIKPEY